MRMQQVSSTEMLTAGSAQTSSLHGVNPSDCLVVKDMRFAWESAKQAAVAPCLDIAQFTIRAGESVFLYGASGSGKSTLLALLGGILTPQQGTITALGVSLTDLSAAQRDRFRVDHIGFIFQQFNLIPYLSVLENVILPCRFSARRQQRASEDGMNVAAQAERLLRALGLHESSFARPVTSLSVGQQQRVAAARALIGRPEIVIADEPTSALDADSQVQFLNLLANECAASGASLLFVSHDHRLAAHFSRAVDLRELNQARAEALVAPSLGAQG
jgi:putative ABC transport system ATP-binding protein